MASTETQALKIIWENKGKASLLKIAKELKFNIDYCRLISRDLVKDKFVEFFEGEYKITDLGKKELERLGLQPTRRPPRGPLPGKRKRKSKK